MPFNPPEDSSIPPNDFFAGRGAEPPPASDLLHGFLQQNAIPSDIEIDDEPKDQTAFLDIGLGFMKKLKK